MSENPVDKALDDFVRRYTDYAGAEGGLTIEIDPQWLSPCLSQPSDPSGRSAWQPVLQDTPVDFSDCERALELSFHEDVKRFYQRYWSQGLNASTPRGPLQLLLVWNDDDAVMLRQNLIGHVMMKQRLGQPETLFIAVTDDDDFMISVDNQSGSVWLEPVGMEPTEQLAPDLASFLNDLRPGPPF